LKKFANAALPTLGQPKVTNKLTEFCKLFNKSKTAKVANAPPKEWPVTNTGAEGY